VIDGDEYLEIIPSVKPITDISFGTFLPSLVAILIAVTAKISFTANMASKSLFWIRFSTVDSKLSVSSIFRIKFSSTFKSFDFKAFK
jgi:hypothetical protein